MKTWIGGQENLQPGDVITAWRATNIDGVTLQVQRIDPDTAEAIGARIREVSHGDGGYYDHQFTEKRLQRLLAEFGVRGPDAAGGDA